MLGNAGLWLLVLAALAWWRRDDRRLHLVPTLMAALALVIVILAAAPISEGRYGLFILICAQAATLYAVVERGAAARANAFQPSSSGSISSGG